MKCKQRTTPIWFIKENCTIKSMNIGFFLCILNYILLIFFVFFGSKYRYKELVFRHLMPSGNVIFASKSFRFFFFKVWNVLDVGSRWFSSSKTVVIDLNMIYNLEYSFFICPNRGSIVWQSEQEKEINFIQLPSTIIITNAKCIA